MRYPNVVEARRILNGYHLPANIIEHSEEVSRNSLIISSQIADAGNPVDLVMVEVGGLLHDIGRCRYLSESGAESYQDFHEHATGMLLRELGYAEFGEMLQQHPLGGLTSEEASALGFPEAIDMMPDTTEIKIICIADKIRPANGIYTLEHKIRDYKTNCRLHDRYFGKLPGLLETTVERITSLWNELVSLGMHNPPIPPMQYNEPNEPAI